MREVNTEVENEVTALDSSQIHSERKLVKGLTEKSIPWPGFHNKMAQKTMVSINITINPLQWDARLLLDAERRSWRKETEKKPKFELER